MSFGKLANVAIFFAAASIAAIFFAVAAVSAANPSNGLPLSGDEIRFEPESRRITTDVYDYLPSTSNPFVFQRINFGGQTAVDSGGLDLYFKPKNFFDIHLDETDLTGHVKQTAVESGSVLLDMNFLLRFLFFKIDVDVSTAALFRREQATMPLIFKVPLDSRRILIPGSGALYSWHERTAKITDSAKACNVTACYFSFSGDLPTAAGSAVQRRFKVQMEVPQNLVAQGFAPELIHDHRDLAATKGWPVVRESNTPRTGIYFEVSGLGKGQYQITYNIGLHAADGG